MSLRGRFCSSPEAISSRILRLLRRQRTRAASRNDIAGSYLFTDPNDRAQYITNNAYYMRRTSIGVPIDRIIMKIETLEDLLVDELKDIYSAENQMIKALPKMAKAAEVDELRIAFQEHLEETRVIEPDRLCRLFGLLTLAYLLCVCIGHSLSQKVCKATKRH